jgi:pimeloyl-ACP methyl ester carboxylesterase
MSHKVAVALLYGLGGSATSPGIVQLYDEIKKIPDVAVLIPYDQSNWQVAAHDISKYTVEKLVVIGYSMGANATTMIADALKPRAVSLLVAIQPTMYEGADTIGPNVVRAVEIYNPNVLETGGLGSRRLTGTHVQYVVNSDSHAYADEDPAVHKLVLDEIHKLLA